jgi:hypothetical protein
VAQLYGQQAQTISGDLVSDQMFKGLGQVQLSQTLFDADFPATRHTEVELVVGVEQQPANMIVQSFRFMSGPQQHVRV